MNPARPPAHRRLSRRQVRAALGVLWLVDATLQAQPHLFGADWWRNDLPQSVMGQPAPIARSILWGAALLGAHPAIVNGALVATEAAFGVALLAGRLERAAIAASVPVALGVWWIGEGFGALPTGFATLAGGAPGPVLYYAAIGLLAWPRGASGEIRSPDPGVVASAGRSVWAALWVGGAVLELPLSFPAARVLQANIEENSVGEPRWLAHLAHVAYQAVGSHPLVIPGGLAAIQLAIGVGVLNQRTLRPALAGGAVLAGVFWVLVQDLAAIPAGAATDVSTGPLMVLLAASLWPEARPRPSPLSDSRVEPARRLRQAAVRLGAAVST